MTRSTLRKGRCGKKAPQTDPRFHPVLRLDRILNKWPDHWSVLESKGYAVDRDASGASVSEVRRFLTDWLPPDEAGLHGRIAAGHVRVPGGKRSSENC